MIAVEQDFLKNLTSTKNFKSYLIPVLSCASFLDFTDLCFRVQPSPFFNSIFSKSGIQLRKFTWKHMPFLNQNKFWLTRGFEEPREFSVFPWS